jgi:hypothetical protein
MPPERPNRGAAAFDAFRRELIRRALPVQKTERKAWEERFKEFVEASLPAPKKLFQKPGLAARLFASEIEVPNSHPRDLEVYAQQLDLIFEAKLPKDVVEWRTLTSPDRTDLVWEFAVDLGATYVTGSVKLRNYPFERPERKPRDGDGERRPYQRRDEGERRPYQRRDEGQSGDRERRPYQRRDEGERRPYQRRDEGERRPYQRRDEGESRPYQRRDEGERRPYQRRDEGESRPYQKRDDGDRPKRPYVKRDDSDRPKRPYVRRDDGDRPKRPYVKREDGDRPKRPYVKRDDGDRPKRPYVKREDGDRPKRPYKPSGDRPYKRPSSGGPKKFGGSKPPYKRKPKD